MRLDTKCCIILSVTHSSIWLVVHVSDSYTLLCNINQYKQSCRWKAAHTDARKTYYTIPVCTTVFRKFKPPGSKHVEDIKSYNIGLEKVHIGLYCIIIQGYSK